MLTLNNKIKTYTLNTKNIIPSIGLGTWLAFDDDAYNAIRVAIANGYRLIDCAARYNNERIIGKAINDAIKAGDVKREELFITSKLWNDSHKQDDVKIAFEKSLKDLGLDYIDLYMMHWPVAIEKGTNAPISLKELPLQITWEAMTKLLEKSYLIDVGVANFSIKKLELLKNEGLLTPVVNQVEINLYFQQKKLIEYCKRNNIIPMAAAPLSSQSRAVKPEGEKNPFEDSVVEFLANKYSITKAQLILSFLLTKDIIIIPKSTNQQRIVENYNSVFVKLEQDDIAMLSNLDQNKRVFPGQGMIKGDYTYENLWDEKYDE